MKNGDGTGYPKGLVNKTIPLFGRICALADVFDALTTRRPYKEAFSNEKSFKILQEESGTHFDPKIVEVFFDNVQEIVETQERDHDNEI